MSRAEKRCKYCDRPVAWAGMEWVHRPIEPEQFSFCHCWPGGPHAEPKDAT